jgi:cephalosporin-C deacetylase-like acetyl esterase
MWRQGVRLGERESLRGRHTFHLRNGFGLLGHVHIGHYLEHPDLSAMGRMFYDAQRALDVLVAIEGVDRQRVGVIGHSLGAEETLMLVAFDERVKTAVASER